MFMFMFSHCTRLKCRRLATLCCTLVADYEALGSREWVLATEGGSDRYRVNCVSQTQHQHMQWPEIVVVLSYFPGRCRRL